MNRAASISTLLGATLWVAFLVIAVCNAGAQVSKGSVPGTVLDPSGAAVAGGDVKVTNTDTGLSATTKTGATGNFRINLLPVGTYSLAVKK